MSKWLFPVVILATELFASTFSSSNLAADCPVIPATIKEVTVKDSKATLRKEPKQGELDKNRPKIIAGDLLKVLDNKPTENENHCWYKVNPVRNKNQDQEWWIAGNLVLEEFDSWKNTAPWPSVTPTAPAPPGRYDTRKASQAKKQPSQKEQPVSPLLWLAIALGGVGTVGSIGTLIFCILRFSKQEESLVKQINTPVRVRAVAQIPVPAFEPVIKKDMIDEMVEQFNGQNRDYFQGTNFQPLTLTKQSLEGRRVGLDGCRIVQLEVPPYSSHASYLTIEINRENWLIPNITSPYISQIIRNLKETPQIFIVHPGSGTLRLVKPAKLKNIGFELWEIKEPGEFSQGEIPNIKVKTVLNQVFLNTVELEKASTLDLPIILYLRKNGDTNLTDLLNNLQCDQEQLKERLIVLQQEELIKIIKQNDPNNPLCQLR